MKKFTIILLLLVVLLAGCSPTQRITGSWVNREALPYIPLVTTLLKRFTIWKVIFTIRLQIALSGQFNQKLTNHLGLKAGFRAIHIC